MRRLVLSLTESHSHERRQQQPLLRSTGLGDVHARQSGAGTARVANEEAMKANEYDATIFYGPEAMGSVDPAAYKYGMDLHLRFRAVSDDAARQFLKLVADRIIAGEYALEA